MTKCSLFLIWSTLLYLIIDVSEVLCRKRGRNLNVSNRAPAQWSKADCMCQCASTSFKDKWGDTHGNCRR